MSWFQDLAGKAENILNKIDQNAATVLHQQKSDQSNEPLIGDDSSNPNHLIEVMCDSVTVPKSGSSLRDDRPAGFTPKNMLSLKKSPAVKRPTIEPGIPVYPTIDPDIFDNVEMIPMASTTTKSSSNSTSRRSSLSSRGDRTVIETDQQNGTANPAMTTSATSSVASAAGSIDPELAALRIVLNEIKTERDECKDELETLREQINNANTRSVIKDLQTVCVQLREEQETLIQR